LGTASASNTSNNNATITLPALSNGDVVYVFVSVSGTAAMTTSGYTSVGGSLGEVVFRKVMGGSPDATAVVTGDSSFQGVSATAICLRGVNATPEDTASTTATGLLTNPTNAAITTATNGAWVLVFVGEGANVAVPTVPTGYSNNNGASVVTRMSAGAAKLKSTAGVETPGSWTGGAFATWHAVTVAVRPA
jgi:hypothetical protein